MNEIEIKSITTEDGTARYYKDDAGWWIDIGNGCGFLLEHGAETEGECIEAAEISLEEDRLNNPQ